MDYPRHGLRTVAPRGGRWPTVSSIICCAIVASVLAPAARADKITLSDGRELEGKIARLNSMTVQVTGQGEMPASKLIVMVDDDLSRTYVPFRWVEKLDPAGAAQALEEIDVPQNVASAGGRLGSVGQALQITPFDEFGRRTFSMVASQGRFDVVQGITKITPVWTRVEGLQVKQSYIWDMRIATSSIPRQTLSQILARQIDPKNVDDRLKIVRLYLQAERYKDAEEELAQVLAEFPDRDSLREVARDLKQLGARQLLTEIDTRRTAGQHRLVYSMLEQFPSDGVSGQLLQQVRERLQDYNQFEEQRKKIADQVTQLTAGLTDSALRLRAEPLAKEIADELFLSTLDRMATFRRFADDEQVPSENKLALAISGWLVGADDATENLQVALALADLRTLIVRYLKEEVKLRRDELLAKIEAQEFVSPKFVAAIAARIKPPRDTPPGETPGFYELSVPTIPDEDETTYYVQLPPEYDPHFRYPAIVTLNGAYNTPPQQIDWWAGPLVKSGDRVIRTGQAARFGYIVIAPAWMKPHQKQYEGSPREHTAVLASLRDACRRFSIDTDRVFLSGHSVGGDAAWDLGLAHPDLWAGVIPIVARAGKAVQLYWQNAGLVPFYFVCGDLDGDKMVRNAPQFDRYMNRSVAFDCTVVEYLGRGHEHFSDEILRLFDWMGRKRRDFFPREFSIVTQRAWDDFFWWVELQGSQPGGRSIPVKANVTASNGLVVKTAGKPIVWLAPELVDFSREITVTINGQRAASGVRPSLETLLEDIRTRGDRQHPFWAKVE